MKRFGRRKRRKLLLPLIFLCTLTVVGGWWYLRPTAAGDTGGTQQIASAAVTAAPDAPVASLRLGSESAPATDPADDRGGNRSEDSGDDAAVQPALTVLAAAEQPDEILEPRAGAAQATPFETQGEHATPDRAVETEIAQLPHRLVSAGEDRSNYDPPGASEADPGSTNPALAAAWKRATSGAPIAGRQELNALLKSSLTPAEQVELRRMLTGLAKETIFSKRRLPDDPLIDWYTVQPGDVLIQIGRRFEVPHEVIMSINGIPDAGKLRAEQMLKVPRGPFHARIYNSAFRIDVYLQDLYVRSFPVGLGADQGTPEGVWKVKERLPNPTYFPPPTAPIKRIIPADDPSNPLGEHWIGLEGIEGDAVGRYGFGIHGTIEPESIGKAVSLGCIRMHNEDVAFVYSVLLPGRSTVTILP